VWRFARLGPPGWVRYLHDSRIVERVSGRVRAGLWRHRENWRERRRDMAPCREARGISVGNIVAADRRTAY